MSRLARAFGDAVDSRNLRVRGEGGKRIENVQNEKQKQEMEVKQQKQNKKKKILLPARFYCCGEFERQLPLHPLKGHGLFLSLLLAIFIDKFSSSFPESHFIRLLL